MAGAARAGAGWFLRFTTSTAALARRHKLEAVALLLTGVGGAVFPPVWLLGVVLVLASRVWDLRDKWTATAGPVWFVILGTVLVLVFGGQQESLVAYAHEAWLGAERLSRVAVALAAAYLFWRLRRGRRRPKQPPWNVPHRLG